jgi:hypothetical protein
MQTFLHAKEPKRKTFDISDITQKAIIWDGNYAGLTLKTY